MSANQYATLSLEQKYAFAKFKEGENLFITGPGGTGKTRLIQYLVHHMKQTGVSYQVCALTGCAAVLLNCGAKTIHSWSGIKMGKGTVDQIISRITRNRTVVKAWRQVEVLIVDEISMLSWKMFDLLDEIGRTLRRNTRPFGGIQLIVTGDFLQLPPVPDPYDPYSSAFCFESPKWPKAFPQSNCIELTTYFRQRDPVYIRILQEIRKGYIEPENVDILQKYVKRTHKPEETGGCIPTKLFPIRNKVDAVNRAMFSQLEGQEYVYDHVCRTNNLTYHDSGEIISAENIAKSRMLSPKDIEIEVDLLLSTIQTNKTLSLKKGAIVMCTTNIDVEEGICNGSQGIILDFVECPGKDHAGMVCPVVRFANGKIRTITPFTRQSDDYPTISVSQVPLCLAWALTIHKIQGSTLEMAEMDIGKSIFECGQTYVALSRIQSLNGLYLSEFQPHKIRASPEVLAFYESLPKRTEDEMRAHLAKTNEPGATSASASLTTKVIQRALEMEAETYDATPLPKPDVKVVKLS
jgi:ATP-dependent DNA helicase PIF1